MKGESWSPTTTNPMPQILNSVWCHPLHPLLLWFLGCLIRTGEGLNKSLLVFNHLVIIYKIGGFTVMAIYSYLFVISGCNGIIHSRNGVIPLTYARERVRTVLHLSWRLQYTSVHYYTITYHHPIVLKRNICYHILLIAMTIILTMFMFIANSFRLISFSHGS